MFYFYIFDIEVEYYVENGLITTYLISKRSLLNLFLDKPMVVSRISISVLSLKDTFQRKLCSGSILFILLVRVYLLLRNKAN